MGVLQDFERRLEGAVEGFFARAFRSGVQPVELAKAIQRYAEDTQHVTEDGIVVPNLYRFGLNPKDIERLESFGKQLRTELGQVVERTASERGWNLRGPGVVRIEEDEDAAFGRYKLKGRVEATEAAASRSGPFGSVVSGSGETGAIPPQPQPKPAPAPAPAIGNRSFRVRLPGGESVPLSGSRVVVGRLPDNPVTLSDPTVSREHAAFVKRGDVWWIVDLGSTNGTRVNGTGAAEHALEPGDRVEFGEVSVDFVGS